jgi:hypothetical protein
MARTAGLRFRTATRVVPGDAGTTATWSYVRPAVRQMRMFSGYADWGMLELCALMSRKLVQLMSRSG